ncbi:MAG: metal-dependent hydrolase [Erysipelotrichia bacterium]|nr:metal-dependent hydrolase [Erysipelotrichia bacterium]
MDLITQGLLGSTVAQAAYGKKLGKRAALYGFLIGLIPDFDIVSNLYGPWVSLKYHRGPTHAFALLLLLSLPIGLMFRKLAGSEVDKRHWVGMAFLALVTHPLLDWFTSYGTCLAWPFSDYRYAIDALPIIDPIYSFPLLAVTMLGLFSKISFRRMQTLAFGALAITCMYSLWSYSTSQILVERGTRLFKTQGFEPVEVRATPTLLNTVVFRVVGRNKDDDFMITYLKKASEQPLSPIVLRKSDHDNYVDMALAHEHGSLFKWFSMNMLHTQSVPLDGGRHKVILSDMRYGLFLSPGQSLFAAEAHFDATGQLIRVNRIHNHGSISIKAEILATLARVFTGNAGLANAAWGAR